MFHGAEFCASHKHNSDERSGKTALEGAPHALKSYIEKGVGGLEGRVWGFRVLGFRGLGVFKSLGL